MAWRVVEAAEDIIFDIYIGRIIFKGTRTWYMSSYYSIRLILRNLIVNSGNTRCWVVGNYPLLPTVEPGVLGLKPATSAERREIEWSVPDCILVLTRQKGNASVFFIVLSVLLYNRWFLLSIIWCIPIYPASPVPAHAFVVPCDRAPSSSAASQ